MKLLFIYKSMICWGGIERVWTDKINWLVNNGHEVKLVTTIQGDHPMPYKIDEKAEIKDLQIQFHYSYRYKRLRRLWDKRCRQKKFEKLLSQELQEYKPDIIICVATMYIPTLVKLKGTIPLIAESHELCLNTSDLSTSPLLKYIKTIQLFRRIRKADCIVALTEGDAKEWRKYNRNVVVIPNTVHINPTGKISECTQKHIIFVGRIAGQKGLPALFDVWEKVSKRHPDWNLEIYGEKNDLELMEWVNYEANKYANVTIHKPTDKIFEMFCESSIFVLTSTYEPFGLVIPEAMSCGLPVVSFDSPYGPADIITDGKDGILVPLGDTEKFADKVCLLIENSELRKNIGATGIISSQRYAAEKIMPQWEKLFNDIISKNKTNSKRI